MVFLVGIAGDHFGGFHFAGAVLDCGCDFGAAGKMVKNPSAEITSQAVARKIDRMRRTVSGVRPVMRAKRDDWGSASCGASLILASAAV